MSKPYILEELLIRVPEGEDFVKNLGRRKLEIMEAVEVGIKYQGYIDRERGVADKIKRLNDLKIPGDIVYETLKSISTEGRQKLEKIQPETIGMANRISGVSPSDISVLIMYLGR